LRADETEAELFELHDRFCSGFSNRDPEAVLATVANGADLVIVTSEDALLEGTEQFRAFLAHYVEGPTTYSWSWDRRQGAVVGGIGLLLAIGTELAATADRRVETPYRMTLAAMRLAEEWVIVQVHASSPHHA
jgi:hypothetical protein